jgi:hypothetical protein
MLNLLKIIHIGYLDVLIVGILNNQQKKEDLTLIEIMAILYSIVLIVLKVVIFMNYILILKIFQLKMHINNEIRIMKNI